MEQYLGKLGCQSIIIEEHYVDSDYIKDDALFYARSLRAYPNYCKRVHFFSAPLDADQWRELMVKANGPECAEVEARLQRSYLGFCVKRPLVGVPIGRTVIKDLGPRSESGKERTFTPLREYHVHVAGFRLTVRGLAFQQQDQGVSACATTALWTALHAVTHREALGLPAPAQITEAAARHQAGNRSLPSQGLTIQQICEATRTFGLDPLVLTPRDPQLDRADLIGYLNSGFPVILALRMAGSLDGHAVCAVGLKLGDLQPPTDPQLPIQDWSSRVEAVYIHDDRLGPYACADLESHTIKGGGVATKLNIKWPGTQASAEESLLEAMIVPVPIKIRLTMDRIHNIGRWIAPLLMNFGGFNQAELRYGYHSSRTYLQEAHRFGLSDRGLYELCCETTLSRYVGYVRVLHGSTILADVLLDTTETAPNPMFLAVIGHPGWPPAHGAILTYLAEHLDARAIQ